MGKPLENENQSSVSTNETPVGFDRFLSEDCAKPSHVWVSGRGILRVGSLAFRKIFGSFISSEDSNEKTDTI